MIDGYNVVEENGRAPKSRFTDPAAFSAIYSRLTDDDMVEAHRRAKIRQMYDGNLPYNPMKLAQCGLKNIANVNFLGLKGVIDNRADAVLKLASDTTNLVELRPLSPEVAGPDADKKGAIVAEEFSRTIREVGRLIPALSMMNREADLYGLGPVAWASAEDYNPVALERGQVRFIPNGPVNSSQHELFMFETTLPAHYLFYLLDNQADAAAEGWDVPTVKRWLVDAFHNGMESRAQPGTETDTSYVESNLALIRQNRFVEEHQFDELHVIHAFVKEMGYPRGITHLIAPAAERKSFLFRKQHAYQTMDECFLWFPFTSNERYARAVRGLASFLYPIEMLNNRFTCQMVDVAFRSASFILAQKTAGAQQSLTINEQGPYTVLPAEFTPAQSQVAPNFQQLATMKQMLDGVGVASVTGADKPALASTGPKVQEGQTQGQTKAEVEIQQKLRSRKEEALFVQRITVFDKVFRETFKRFIRIAVSQNPVKYADYPEIPQFIDRCMRRGVTLEELAMMPQTYTVGTCRDLILGSDGVVGVLKEFLGTFGGTFDEAGRKAGVREMIRLRLGSCNADRLLPPSSRDQLPSDQSSLATIENGMMKSGQAVLCGQDQWHWSHIPVHMQILQEIMQTVQANPDNEGSEQAPPQVENPQQMLQLLAAASKHIQEHLALGKQQIGMQQQAQQVEAVLHGKELRATIKALHLALATQERVQQAQQEQAQRDEQARIDQLAEEKARVAQIEADKKAEVDMYRVDKDHEVALHRLELEGQTAAARSEREDRAAMHDISRRNAESASRVSAAEQMADARVRAADMVQRAKYENEVTGGDQTSPADFYDTDMSGSLPYSL